MHLQPKNIFILALAVSIFFIFSAFNVAEALTYDITVIQSSGGKITPTNKSNVVRVKPRANKTFNIIPKPVFHIAEIQVDGTIIFDGTTNSDPTHLKQAGTSKKYTYKFENVNEDHQILAVFEEDELFTLQVSVSGNGTVTSVPGGIKCGRTFQKCSKEFRESRKITLIAKPAKNETFTGWTGCIPEVNPNRCSFTMSSDLIVSADFSGTSGSGGNSVLLTTTLTGSEEVPPVSTGATGTAIFTVNLSTGAITGSVIFAGLSGNATAAHIHQGAAGVNGDIKVTLSGTGGTTSGTYTVPEDTVLTSDLLTALKADELYVNIHSSEHSGGEIRGQIIFLTGGSATTSLQITEKINAAEGTDTPVYTTAGSDNNAVNEILCMLAQSRYDEMLNKGTYSVLIDGKKCGSYDAELWINSSRAGDTSPQIINAWMITGEDMLRIVVITVTESISETNPNGSFTINYGDYREAADGSFTPLGNGFLISE